MDKKTTSHGLKSDNGKLRWSLLPEREVEEVVRILEYGAKKYAPDSWQHLEDGRTRYYDALRRHLQAWRRGEVYDHESKLPHLAHVACNIFFLMSLDRKARRVR